MIFTAVLSDPTPCAGFRLRQHCTAPEAEPSRRQGTAPPGPLPAGADPARDPAAPQVSQGLTIRIVAPGLEDGKQGLIEELAEAFLGQPAGQPSALHPLGAVLPLHGIQGVCLPGREEPAGQRRGDGAVAGFQVDPQRLASHGHQGSASAVTQTQMPALSGSQSGRLARIGPQRRRLGYTTQNPGCQSSQQHPAPQHLLGPLRRQVLQGLPLRWLEPLRAMLPFIEGTQPKDQGIAPWRGARLA